MAQDPKAERSRLRSILAGSAGNMVETFDWFVYAAFALYFAPIFFPKGDQTAQLLGSAAVYAVGFLARPFGAWIMGLYGDRAGRRAAMILAVGLMCLGSLIIGLCPGYAQIGLAAPAILVLARILQGVSMGGEYGASATYLSEMAARDRRGFWSGIFYSTLMSGQLLALLLLLALTAVLPPEAMNAWGWRVAFIVGALMATAVLLMRRGMDETPSFKARDGSRTATWRLVTEHPRETLMVFGLTAGGTLAYYTFGTYMQKFLVNTSGFSRDQSNLITTAALACFVLMQPLSGALSDRFGRRALLLAFGIGGVAMTWPVLSTLAETREPLTAFLLVLGSLAVVSGYTSVSAIVKAEMFPTEIRALGVALPYAIANALFGGTAEFIALSFKQAGFEPGFYIYVTAVIGVSLVTYLLMPDTRRTSRILED
ncbi:MAG: MFS transporter [Phenylobacterium sp.]|jgi:MHS family alpha-ketoglutarate permease-like MFS transporter|uniref:MFS transporter n=1 Tax=Phenylobacterium sp. TaxID=1871053 RepID=UPI0025FA2B40|nr:MFS transporter [Phenylobacterium sp.]MCA3710172.1 MFS transporter [Phenylobacterium sp.]MCA3715879.1 MFS transporter [Phenylobacterium sp.]MCA3758498.1 MFS transporter [Phenylobacterium sp.]MCA4916893.1 MFS transporter [Phenylobacterium sp.]MCE2818663.1 MFS transporter [Phenylobacterium sp.]